MLVIMDQPSVDTPVAEPPPPEATSTTDEWTVDDDADMWRTFMPVDDEATFARSNRGSIAWQRNKGDISKLIKYWTVGKGRARIGWGKPCDFCSCVRILRRYVPRHMVKGFCARLHHRALGTWPGREKGGRHGKGHCNC